MEGGEKKKTASGTRRARTCTFAAALGFAVVELATVLFTFLGASGTNSLSSDACSSTSSSSSEWRAGADFLSAGY